MNTMRRGILVVPTVALAVALSAIPVLAFDARAGDNVTVSAGEVVNEDVYLAGQTVVCNATVNGDVFAGGQTLTISGVVANGVTAGGQTVLVNASVGHGVRAAGNTVDITSDVGRDVMTGCSTLTIHDSAAIAGDLAFGAGTAVIRGVVRGNVEGAAKKLTIESSIGGDVTVKVETLVIGPGATIDGNLAYSGPNEATIPAGVVKGTVTFTERVDRDSARDPRMLGPLAFFAGLTWKIIAYLMAFLTGLILILLAPWRMAGAATSIRTDTGPVAGYGAIALFVTPLAALVVCLTVIGLPLGIITLLLWGILLYLSQIPVSLFIGHAILGRNKPLESKGFMIGCLALGLLLLTLARAIPFVGLFVSLASGLFGLGAFVVTGRRLMRSHGVGQDFPMP